MTPENILQSDLLDILFEGRNKTYGAYYIRRHYNGYLLKALVLSLLLVILLVFISSLKVDKHSTFRFAIDDQPTLKVLPPVVFEPPPAIAPAKQKQVASIKAGIYRIVPPQVPVTEPVPDVTELMDKKIGLVTLSGPIGHDLIAPSETGLTAGNNSEAVKELQHTGPYTGETVDESAEYPGGTTAMINFLVRHMRHPKQETRETLKVKVQFIVGVDGIVSSFKVLLSAGENIDQEVLRALRKMPKWKPARKNGKQVAMYFVQPVTFNIAEE